MIIPLFVAAILNTLCPWILRIGSYSQALLSDDGLRIVMLLTLLFTGTQMKIKDIPEALKRGGSYVLFKYLAGAYNGLLHTLVVQNMKRYLEQVKKYKDVKRKELKTFFYSD
jgi:hypothetical protein